MITVFQMIGASFILVVGMMILLWVVYLFRKNAGIVDLGWAIGYIITVWTYFSFGEGSFWRRLLIAVLVSLWGFRLASHLWKRFFAMPEDPRYASLRESWGLNKSNFKFFMLFLFQGVLVIILSIPFLIICLSNKNWSWFEFAGFVVWIFAFAGETFADLQLTRFKKEKKEGVCQEGLWHYSRHPNYFFEWLIWVGYFLIALPAAGGWIAIISPLLMLYLLLCVSGIPPTETEAIKAHGEAYREYQKTTSSFIPWFPFRSS